MEEVGLLGARQIAYSLKPDVALVVDVTHATDYPTVNKAAARRHQSGQGPDAHARRLQSSGSRRANRSKSPRSKKIKLQHEAMSATSGTDTDVIFWTRGGIPSALISLPNRYMHSPVELVSLKDLEKIPDLLGAFAASLKKGRRIQGEDLGGDGPGFQLSPLNRVMG